MSTHKILLEWKTFRGVVRVEPKLEGIEINTYWYDQTKKIYFYDADEFMVVGSLDVELMCFGAKDCYVELDVTVDGKKLTATPEKIGRGDEFSKAYPI